MDLFENFFQALDAISTFSLAVNNRTRRVSKKKKHKGGRKNKFSKKTIKNNKK
jgi:hypothetical protein